MDLRRSPRAPRPLIRARAEEYAKLAREYGCTKIVGDNYAGGWVPTPSPMPVSSMASPVAEARLYLEAVPRFNQGVVSLPNKRTSCASCACLSGECTEAARTASTIRDQVTTISPTRSLVVFTSA